MIIIGQFTALKNNKYCLRNKNSRNQINKDQILC